MRSSEMMWSVAPEQIWNKPRRPGISGFMRLKNEAEFLDRAIASHLNGLDELIIVYNDCSDETPEIAARWAHKWPTKITLVEYEPKIVPYYTRESLSMDPRSPHCIANYYNFALSLTNCKIAIKIDGDHCAITSRFNRICDVVRKSLGPKERYPIYGLNIAIDQGEIVIYNYYGFSPTFTCDLADKRGPQPFTSGDHCFYYVDETCWHIVDPVEGCEFLDHKSRTRFRRAPMTYAFFHLKGMKRDYGTDNWHIKDASEGHVRANWARNVTNPNRTNLASIAAMRAHNPSYFRGVDVERELLEAFPGVRLREAWEADVPPLGLRERLAHLWYKLAYP